MREFLCALLACAWCIGCAGDDEPVATPMEDAGSMPECTRCGACPELLPQTSAKHVVGPIEYAIRPPAGGDHDPCWASWGVHADAVPERNWVHNLEHGGVVFLHNCPDGCAADLAKLTELANAHERTLLTPYPELRVRFAAIAWGVRLQSDCFDLRAFQAFYDAHFNHGLEAIASAPPASCQ